MGTKEQQEPTQDELAKMWTEEATKAEPAAEPTQAVVAEPIAAEVAPVVADPVVDPLAGLPDALKDKLGSIDKMAERLRSVEGHIGGLSNGQKQIKDLLTASQEAAKSVTAAPTQNEVKAAVTDPEAWQSLKQEFPEWSNAVESFVDARIAGVAPTNPDAAKLDTLVDAKLAKITPALRRELVEDFLEGEFGNWKDEVKTPEFSAWFALQPEEVKVLATSEKISAAAKLLRLFKTPPVVVVDPGKEIKDARQKKLDDAAALPKGAQIPAAKSIEDMTEAELWEYEAQQTAKRKAARGY